MKTKKLTLVAAFTTTLLSTTAFADWRIDDFTTTNTSRISVTLTITEHCTISNLDKTNKNVPLDSSTNIGRISLSVSCNSGNLPKLMLQSRSKPGKTEFALLGSDRDADNEIAYTVTYGSQAVQGGVKFPLNQDPTYLTFTASPTDNMSADVYTDIITATVTL